MADAGRRQKKSEGGGGGGGPEWAAVKIAASSLALVKGYQVGRSLSWKVVSESSGYQMYEKACEMALKWASPNGYLPLLEDGKSRQTIPSSSPQVFKRPGLDLEECASLRPWKLAGLTLKNRVIRAAAFDGVEINEMRKMHEGLARGGVGMTVLAYCSVSDDGRTFDGQIVLSNREESKSRLKPVTDAVHRHGAAMCAQLTHAGSFAHRETIGTQQVSASVVFNVGSLCFPRAATKEDLQRLVFDFVQGARTAVFDCGFDAVEVHLGHGYLLSQFLSPGYNRRTDEYGGDPVRRCRLPCEIVRGIREALGDKIPILVKLNAQDGFNGGLELPDALITAELTAKAGANLIVVSTGFTSDNSFYMLRGTTPHAKLVQALPGFGMKFSMLAFGPIAVPAVPFEECFLRDHARAILAHINRTGLGNHVGVCLLGGVSTFSQMEGAIAEGFQAVQMARPLIREPDFLLRIVKELENAREDRVNAKQRDEPDEFDVESKCIRCNECVISSVDPLKDIGCPFRKLEEKSQAGLSISPTTAKAVLGDIEDLCSGPRL